MTAYSSNAGPRNSRSTFRPRQLAGAMVIALAASAAIYTARAEFSGGTPFSGAGAVSLATPAVATPSLADLVEKVRPAVVSIRVRLAVVGLSPTE